MDPWSWILLMFCGVLSCEAQVIPSFTLNPQGGVFGSGTSVTLRCAASGSVSFLVWIQNDLVTTPPVFGGTLTIASLTAAMSGSYRCLAVGTGGINVTSSVALVQIVGIEGESVYSIDSMNPTELTVNSSQPFVTQACGNFTNVTGAITYAWTNLPDNLIPVSHQTVSLLDGSLFLQFPNANNNGKTYKCKATVTAPSGSQQVKVGYLRISVAPQGEATSVLIVQPQSLVVNPGETAQFLCASAGGSSPPSVSWTYQTVSGTTTNIQSNAYLGSSHVDIVVTTVNAGNQGIYTCTSQTGISYSSTLIVRSRPVIDASNSLALTPVSFLYGVAFTLSCNASGNELTWLWYHNGMRLSGTSGRLLVVPSPTLDDSGIYQCFAYNPFSNVSATGNISVQTLPATFTNGTALSNTIAFIGQRFQFTCKAQGAPAPTYRWYKDGVVLSSSTTISVDVIGGTFTINSVDATFAGNYTCVATNQNSDRNLVFGSVSSSANLIAIGATIITQSLPADLSIQVGDRVSLPCLATSAQNTQLVYNWTKDGVPLSVTGGLSYTGAGGGITISSVRMSDAGLYQCTVYTLLLSSMYPPVSLRTNYTRITVSDTPVSPVITRLAVLSGTALSVTWTYSGLPAKLNFFLVQVMALGSGIWTNSSTISQNSVTMTMVGSLTPFTAYMVQVVAVLNDGTFVGSKVSTTMTLQAAPTEAPSGLLATPIGASSLQLTWKAPSKSGSSGILTDYCVQYREEGSNGPYTELYVGSNDTMYLLTGLKPLFSYEVRVAANTSVGRGPFTTVTITAAYSNGDTSFTETVGFIAMLVGIGLGIAALMMVILTVVVWRRHHRTKIYRVKSGTFMSTEDVHLERDIIQDYEMRGQKFQLQVQQQNGMETDGASYSESIHTNQTGGSSTYMLQAPAYINPPSFEEFSKRSRAYSRDRLNEDFQDNDVAKDPELHVRTHSQSSLKQQFEQENGFRVRTHSESSSKQQFEQENGFRVRTHSQSGSKHQPEHESDGDVSIEKPSLSSTPSDSEGVFQLEGKMANAIATGTFV